MRDLTPKSNLNLTSDSPKTILRQRSNLTSFISPVSNLRSGSTAMEAARSFVMTNPMNRSSVNMPKDLHMTDNGFFLPPASPSSKMESKRSESRKRIVSKQQVKYLGQNYLFAKKIKQRYSLSNFEAFGQTSNQKYEKREYRGIKGKSPN